MTMATRGKWFGRGGSHAAGGNDGEVITRLRTQHLLLLPSTVGVEEMSELLRTRVPDGGDLSAGDTVILGRHSSIAGPHELSMEAAVDAAVPMPWTLVYALHAPVEREDPPWPNSDDRDGFAMAFPDGLPWREEGRGLHLLVALARRLRGAVRVADGHLIQPDPERAIDHTVFSPYWLDPEVLLGVVARVLPSATLATQTMEWGGPPREAYTGEIVLADIAHDPLNGQELADLHHRADHNDRAVLSDDEVLDRYAIVGTSPTGPQDGQIEVLVRVCEEQAPAVALQEWSMRPFVVYEVRWACPDQAQRERRLPTEPYLASRERTRPVVNAVTRSVYEAATGIVTDEDGFGVDPYFI
jgi:hypothetical protein